MGPITTPNRLGFWRVKRAIDIVGAATLVILTAPILITVALLVRASSPGPIFFRQRRVGRHNKPFWCYKFRSMVVDAEAILQKDAAMREKFGENFKLKEDPRVTPVGQFLRESSLDELPQLFNVLRGDMSLIGPRPVVPAELERYGESGNKLLSVTPGLSGMWQASGRSDTSYTERVAMDMDYIERRTVWLDIKLIAKTAIAVFRRNGAC